MSRLSGKVSRPSEAIHRKVISHCPKVDTAIYFDFPAVNNAGNDVFYAHIDEKYRWRNRYASKRISSQPLDLRKRNPHVIQQRDVPEKRKNECGKNNQQGAENRRYERHHRTRPK